MFFASAAVSAAQKPCQPLRNLRFQGTWHLLPFAQIRITCFIGTKAELCPYNVTANRKEVFPRRGVPAGKRGQAPTGPPLIRGKTKGQVWGQGSA